MMISANYQFEQYSIRSPKHNKRKLSDKNEISDSCCHFDTLILTLQHHR